jgi:hypothetical protein
MPAQVLCYSSQLDEGQLEIFDSASAISIRRRNFRSRRCDISIQRRSFIVHGASIGFLHRSIPNPKRNDRILRKRILFPRPG